MGFLSHSPLLIACLPGLRQMMRRLEAERGAIEAVVVGTPPPGVAAAAAAAGAGSGAAGAAAGAASVAGGDAASLAFIVRDVLEPFELSAG